MELKIYCNLKSLLLYGIINNYDKINAQIETISKVSKNIPQIFTIRNTFPYTFEARVIVDSISQILQTFRAISMSPHHSSVQVIHILHFSWLG